MKNGSGGITAWHFAKILQTEKKPTPLYKIYIKSAVREHFPDVMAHDSLLQEGMYCKKQDPKNSQ